MGHKDWQAPGDCWTVKFYGEARDSFVQVLNDLRDRKYVVRITAADFEGDAVIERVHPSYLTVARINEDGERIPDDGSHPVDFEGLDEIYVY